MRAIYLKLLRYYWTLRCLKLSQLVWRLRYRYYHPRAMSLDPHQQFALAVWPGRWTPSILRPKPFIAAGRIVFLNQSVQLTSELWQASRQQSKLWRYNLHYFEALLAADSAERARALELLGDWHNACPPGTPDAWEPYPLSLRIVNMIKYQGNGEPLPAALLASLYQQAQYLSHIPEYHLLGNHLFENAKALIFAGLFFEGKEAKRWRALGERILNSQIPEQVLADGGHFELSPMYQVIILEGLLDLYNLYTATAITFPSAWLGALQKMRWWLQVMTHPDGEVSFFNDAATGIAVSPARIEDYAIRLGLSPLPPLPEGITVLAESGYVRLQQGATVVLLDCARIGPDYLPGHAHADTLSFELSLGSKRVVVNAGTSTYDPANPLRAQQRSTALHSTVQVAGQNSSEVWGAFRVARRVYPGPITQTAQAEKLSVRCAYRHPYGHAPYTHTREWELSPQGLVVRDDIDAPAAAPQAVARFYLHPACLLQADTGGTSIINALHYQCQVTVSSGTIVSKPSAYYPEFGLSQATHMLESQFQQQQETRFVLV